MVWVYVTVRPMFGVFPSLAYVVRMTEANICRTILSCFVLLINKTVSFTAHYRLQLVKCLSIQLFYLKIFLADIFFGSQSRFNFGYIFLHDLHLCLNGIHFLKNTPHTKTNVS